MSHHIKIFLLILTLLLTNYTIGNNTFETQYNRQVHEVTYEGNTTMWILVLFTLSLTSYTVGNNTFETQCKRRTGVE